MKTREYSAWTCCIAVIALCSQISSNAAEETWQSLLAKAQTHFHITEKEIAEREKNKAVKTHVPVGTPQELQLGRVEITKAVKLAKEKVLPLDGLKTKQTALDVMTLASTVGYTNALDAVTIATMFNEYKEQKDQDRQHMLSWLRRTENIAKRQDELTQDVVALVGKAFGTDKNAKLQFKDNNIKDPNAIHDFVVGLQKAAVQTHEARTKLEAQIKNLEAGAEKKSGK